MNRVMRGVLLMGPALLFVGCAAGTTGTTTPTPSPVAVTTVSPSPAMVARSVTETRTVANKDGSTTVVISYSDGSKTEERTFKAGELAKVRRSTSAAGVRTGHVTYRKDSREVEVKDPSWVETSMEATGSALTTAAKATEKGVTVAAEKTAEGAKTAGKATAKGAAVAAEKTVEGVKALGAGAKKLGQKIKP